MRLRIALAASLLFAACSPKPAAPAAEGSGTAAAAASPTAPPAANPGTPAAPAAAQPAAGAPAEGSGASVESKEFLARQPKAEEVVVRHILISWKDQAEMYARRGGQDPRAAARDRAAANALVLATLERIKKGEDFKALMAELSEDPGSNKSGSTYTVEAAAPFVPGFKNLALRLDLNEVGVVETPFGYHIMRRETPPPPDPAVSADILARQPVTETAVVLHVLISWKDLAAIYAQRGGQDPRGAARTIEDARKAAADVVAAAKSGKDFKVLMSELSEDPGSSKSGQTYTITKDAPFMPEFVKLGLRLNKDEIGIVQTDFGFHVMKRTE
jgi:parvulin-like peptidyl-prolyl isomerase